MKRQPQPRTSPTLRVLELPEGHEALGTDDQHQSRSEPNNLLVLVPAGPPELSPALAQAFMTIIAKSRSTTSGHQPAEGLSSKAS